MLRTVLSNLVAPPSTRPYPYMQREPFPEARGRITLDVTRCAFCGACARRCPSGALTVRRNEKEVVLEPFRCIVCEACREVCPRQAIDLNPHYRPPAYEKSSEVYRATETVG